MLQMETGATPVLRRGEISPKEFVQFIGKEISPSKVEYAPEPEAAPSLNFYRGKNTPKREYIMERQSSRPLSRRKV